MELETLKRILIQKWRILVTIFIVTIFSTLLFTLNQPRIYEAKATYVAKLSPTITDNREFAVIIDTLSSRTEISTTYAEVANSRRIKSLAGQELKLSQEDLSNLSVSSRLIPGTNVLEIVVQGRDPLLVGNFATVVGNSTIEYVQSLYETFTLEPLDNAGVPKRPIQPNVVLNLFFGSLLGLVLGGGVALLLYFFQTSGEDFKITSDHQLVPEAPSASDSYLLELRQDMANLQEQFESTSRKLNRIQTALRKTNSYAKDIQIAVYELEGHLEGNHSEISEVKQGDGEI